jgi:hypothetical protein
LLFIKDVVVLDLLAVEFLAVAEVEGADVVLDLLGDGLPTVGCLRADAPSCSVQVLLGLTQEASVVEQLLRNATHVHACAYVIIVVPPNPHFVP